VGEVDASGFPLGRRATREQLGALARRPSKRLGQNFLVEPEVARRIVSLAEVGSQDRVVEIGAGLGALTVELARVAGLVVAIELDPKLADALEARLGQMVKIVRGDATRVDWSELLGPQPGWKLVANLPYSRATEMVLDVLERAPQVAEMLVMVQAEVAERLSAAPGSPLFGQASVRVAYWARSRVIAKIPPQVFHPRPKVQSALVRIVRHEPSPFSYPRLVELLRVGFQHRRKMLRVALRGLVSEEQLREAGIDPQRRAETLGLEEWRRLVECL
jgi:16S rRNA (adenine1518-N6/adenine1519-N6)-dimethyltransferase